MFSDIKAAWKSMGRGTPGRRFQARFEQHQRSRAPRRWLTRLFRLIGATVAIAIGVVLAFIPGPAILFFLLAGALLAADSLWIARSLDWIEVRARRLARWARKVWRRLPTYGRLALIAVGGCLSLASTYGVYRLMN